MWGRLKKRKNDLYHFFPFNFIEYKKFWQKAKSNIFQTFLQQLVLSIYICDGGGTEGYLT